jgi:hypothetical protein
VRRRRGGVVGVMFGVDSTDISDGFPDIASGGNIRSCFLLISVGAGGRSVRYVNQLAQKTGWALVPTSTGGSVGHTPRVLMQGRKNSRRQTPSRIPLYSY